MARFVRLCAFAALLSAMLVLAGEPQTVYSCKGPRTSACTNMSDFLMTAHMNRTAASMNAAFATADSWTGTPIEYVSATGRFTYDENSAHSTADTEFDMASCSKIMAGTTAVAQLYQAGLIGLDDLVTDYLGDSFAAHGKGGIRIHNLLVHNAGFPPDPNPGYSSPVFPCPQNANYHPGQDFSCEDIILANLLYNQTLQYPTGTQFIYSDLSFITVMFVVGSIVKQNNLVPPANFPPVCYHRTNSLICNYYAYVKTHVFERMELKQTSYIPDTAYHTPPAWVDPWYHHGLIMGYVSDQNAYAMGGISGHAGVFSTVGDSLKFIRAWINAKPNDPFLNATTVKLFTTVANLTQSSRALGWDTNDQPQPPCGDMSKETFFHIGYTGTQFCADPVSGVVSVLLTNARYPDYHQDGTIVLRPLFNSLVLELVKPQ